MHANKELVNGKCSLIKSVTQVFVPKSNFPQKVAALKKKHF